VEACRSAFGTVRWSVKGELAAAVAETCKILDLAPVFLLGQGRTREDLLDYPVMLSGCQAVLSIEPFQVPEVQVTQLFESNYRLDATVLAVQ